MSRYAILQDGVVVEFVETDGDIATMFHPDIQVVEADECAGIGYTYKGGKLCVPEVDAGLRQQAVNAEARAYLASTDWYVLRQQETGQEIPADILAERAAVRKRVIE